MLFTIMITVILSTLTALLVGGFVVHHIFTKKVTSSSDQAQSNFSTSTLDDDTLETFSTLIGDFSKLHDDIYSIKTKLDSIPTEAPQVDAEALSKSVSSSLEPPEIDVLELAKHIAEILESRVPQEGDASLDSERIATMYQTLQSLADRTSSIEQTLSNQPSNDSNELFEKISQQVGDGFNAVSNNLESLVGRINAGDASTTSKKTESQEQNDDLSQAVDSINAAVSEDEQPEAISAASVTAVETNAPTIASHGDVDHSLDLGAVENELSKRGLTVMMVDDSKTVRKINCKHLKNLSIDAIEAEDGLDAKKKIEEGAKPDVILLDVEMPNMNGIEVAEFIRTKSNISDVPIVMFTSKDREKLWPSAEALGVYDMVNKTNNKDTLMRYIHHLSA